MPKKIPWDEDEAIILLDALIQVLSGTCSRKDAVAAVSRGLRARAIRNGIVIDDTFRNQSGIQMQMSILEYEYTDGKQGWKKEEVPEIFQNVVSLCKNDPATYRKRLTEALTTDVSSKFVQKQFLEWLTEDLPSEQVLELYETVRIVSADIEKLCIRTNISTASLFEITDLELVERILNAINSDECNHHTDERRASKMHSVLYLYRKFLRENGDKIGAQSAPSATHFKPDESSFPDDVGIISVDLEEIRTYAYTKPISFRYFAEEQQVTSWKELYLNCYKCLFLDYPPVFERLVGKPIIGNGRVDVGSDAHISFMKSPVQIAKRLYMETNLSATDFINRLRQLLILCKVDFENLNIKYRVVESTISQIHETKPSLQNMEMLSDEIASNYSTILRYYFPDGFRLNLIPIHVRKFTQKYEEHFGVLHASKDELIVQLREVGVVRDGRIYAKQNSEQSSLINEICREIDYTFQKGASCIYLSMIFLRYGQQLGTQLGIYTEEALQALLLDQNSSKYFIRYGCLCCAEKPIDIASDVLHFIKARHAPVTYDDIQAVLWYIPKDKIKQILVSTASLVNVDRNSYFYAPNLPISSNELEMLTYAIQEEIDLRGFLVGRHLKELIDQHCPAAAIDTASMKDWGIRNALSYILRDHFEFTGALVTGKGQKLSLPEAFRIFCQSRERIALVELKKFADDVKVPIYWNEVLSVAVRISANELVPANHIHFDVEATDAVLDQFCAGDYIPIQSIGLFLQFPPIEFPWNGFVLECYLKNASKRFRLEQVSVTESGFYGVIVRRESRLLNYEQVVIDMLAHSREWTDENSALDLLVSQGYQARRRWKGFHSIIKKALLLREELEKAKK